MQLFIFSVTQPYVFVSLFLLQLIIRTDQQICVCRKVVTNSLADTVALEWGSHYSSFIKAIKDILCEDVLRKANDEYAYSTALAFSTYTAVLFYYMSY